MGKEEPGIFMQLAESGIKLLFGGLEAVLKLVGLVVALLILRFGVEVSLELIETGANVVTGLLPA